MVLRIYFILLLLSLPALASDGGLNPPEQAWFPKAPALPAGRGATVEVSDVPGLVEALSSASPGQTILLADGHYMMDRYVEITADNVTLRSASGRRESVIIDGAKSRHRELLGISACSGVTIADLTIQNIRCNGFKINSNKNVQKLTIYNCIIHNIWQRGVKGVKVPRENRPADNYVAGIDVMYATDWVISDNVFVGIQGRTFEGRGAIFIWHTSRDCVIERNIIIDCDVGLQLGNPHRDSETTYHCVRCIARNNFITRAPEAGIHDPDSRLGRLLRSVFTNDGLVFANNLLSGPGIRNESESEISFSNNLIKDLTDYFINPGSGNLHLKNEEWYNRRRRQGRHAA